MTWPFWATVHNKKNDTQKYNINNYIVLLQLNGLYQLIINNKRVTLQSLVSIGIMYVLVYYTVYAGDLKQIQ